MKIKLSNPKTDQLKANFFFMGILAIIIVVLWITLSVYSAFNKHEPDKELDKLLIPLNPTLDVKTLEEYRATRIEPASEFQIQVVTKEGKKTESFVLNPFTNTTSQAPPVSTGSTALAD